LERVAIRFGYQHGLRLTVKVKIVRYYDALDSIMVPVIGTEHLFISVFSIHD
jgi:hypothetical protein